MPHSRSFSRALANDSFAGSNQKEWNRAMARLKSFCAAALHETGKLTSPSLSGGVDLEFPCSPCCGSLCCAHASDFAKPNTIISINIVVFVIFMTILHWSHSYAPRERWVPAALASHACRHCIRLVRGVTPTSRRASLFVYSITSVGFRATAFATLKKFGEVAIT